MLMFIDFETKSDVDLAECGTHNYVNSPQFSVISSAWYKVTPKEVPGDQDEVTPNFSLGLPPAEEFENVDYIICHNYFFEGSILRKYSLLKKDIIDTMSLCAIAGLPLTLGKAAIALGYNGKSECEHRVKLNLRKKTISEFTPEETQELQVYNSQDVVLTVRIFNRLRMLYTTHEHIIFTDNVQRNFRGLRIDHDLLENKLSLIEKLESEATTEKIKKLSGDALYSIDQVAALAQYLGTPNVQAETLEKLLDSEISEDKKELIKLRLYSKHPLFSKYKKLKKIAHPNIPGGTSLYLTDFLKHYGALTGRFSGKGFQVQNLPSYSEVPITEKSGVKEIMNSLKSSLRGMILPLKDNHVIYAIDYAQIEARILASIAGETELAEQFRAGSKVYETMASKIFKVDVDKVTPQQRQFGKIAILGCGYGMGFSRFEETYNLKRCITKTRDNDWDIVKQDDLVFTIGEKLYNLNCFEDRIFKCSTYTKEGKLFFSRKTLSDWDELQKFASQITFFISELDPSIISGIRVVNEYRKSNSKIVSLWGAITPLLSMLASSATGSITESVGNCEFTTSNKITQKTLEIKLPSGRILYYPEIRNEGARSKVYLRGKSNMEWFDVWGGLITENICQAIGRDILCTGMLALKNEGIPVLFTVHDEYVISAPEGKTEELERIILKSAPMWSRDIPLKIETTVSKHFI